MATENSIWPTRTKIYNKTHLFLSNHKYYFHLNSKIIILYNYISPSLLVGSINKM